MMSRSGPTYPLEALQRIMRDGVYRITRSAAEDAGTLSFGEADIVACVQSLERSDFYKTMPARKRRGLFQDVYRCRYMDQPLYIKVQVSRSGVPVVISFKADEST